MKMAFSLIILLILLILFVLFIGEANISFAPFKITLNAPMKLLGFVLLFLSLMCFDIDSKRKQRDYDEKKFKEFLENYNKEYGDKCNNQN